MSASQSSAASSTTDSVMPCSRWLGLILQHHDGFQRWHFRRDNADAAILPDGDQPSCAAMLCQCGSHCRFHPGVDLLPEVFLSFSIHLASPLIQSRQGKSRTKCPAGWWVRLRLIRLMRKPVSSTAVLFIIASPDTLQPRAAIRDFRPSFRPLIYGCLQFRLIVRRPLAHKCNQANLPCFVCFKILPVFGTT